MKNQNFNGITLFLIAALWLPKVYATVPQPVIPNLQTCTKLMVKTDTPCLHTPEQTTCLECHVDAEKTHAHPVKIHPDKFVPPISWPQVKGDVRCITCHDVSAQKSFVALKDNPSSLRGGPYLSFSNFCFRCHTPLKKKLKKFDPHAAMVDKHRHIQFNVCTNCHSKHIRSPNTKVTPKDLKLPSSLICISCHKRTQHSGTVVHLEKKLSPEMISNLQLFEESNHVHIPLENINRVTCASCHQTHPKQVLDAFHIFPGVMKRKERELSELGQELFNFREDFIQELIAGTKYIYHKNSKRKLPMRVRLPLLCTACHSY